MKLRIGGHLSIALGYTAALESIVIKGGNALQIFSTSPRIWRPAKVSDATCKEFIETKHRLGVDPVFFHASYLINLADNDRIGEVSKQSLIAELTLQPRMEVAGSIVHLGSYKEKEEGGLFGFSDNPKYEVLIKNIKEVLDNTPDESTFIIENVATRKIGKTLEELAAIVKDLNSKRVKICLDTCHLHAAGFDLSTKETFNSFFSTFEKLIGIDKIALFHLNDSRDLFHSYRDRHANLGQGNIPKQVFVNLVNDPRTKNIPFILETPGFDGNGPDAENIAIAQSYII